MHDFASHVLRRYFEATGWNEHNSYLSLTSSSSAILDFRVPPGLTLSFSASPSPPFFTSYRLRALPYLQGAVGYVFSSTDEDHPLDIGRSSANVRFKDMVERFRVVEQPRRPEGKDEVWQGGRRIDTRDYLLYGCMHVPESRLDALYTTRLSPTWQLLLTAVSLPRIAPSAPAGDKAADPSGAPTGATSSGGVGVPVPGATNLQITMQNDTGRWCTEYSYSADDALWGFRVLHNFGSSSSSAPTGSTSTAQGEMAPATDEKLRRVDEGTGVEETGLEAVVGGGLRGRFSAGAELFFSAVEKSAGLSTGIRFTTLPEPASASSSSAGRPQVPSQPPTTITATLNPMMGHLSTAYAARMSRDVVVCSRFDFNVYSYDSELTLGAEYWLRGRHHSVPAPARQDAPPSCVRSGSSSSSSSASASNPASAATSDRPSSSRLVPPMRQDLSLRERERENEYLHLSPTPSSDEPEPLPPTAMEPRDWALRRDVHSPAVEDQTALARADPSTSEAERIAEDVASAPSDSGLPLRSIAQDTKDKDKDSVTDKDNSLTSLGLRSASQLSSSVSTTASSLNPLSSSSPASTSITGVLKARLSTNAEIALLWEGRLRNVLVSLGVVADLSSRIKPVRALGVDIQYFSSAEDARIGA